MNDLETLTKAWMAARQALDTSNEELRLAQAGNETSARCEREAWEAMSKCREQDAKSEPKVASQEDTAEALRRAQAEHSAKVQAQQAEQIRGLTNQFPTGFVSYMARSGW